MIAHRRLFQQLPVAVALTACLGGAAQAFNLGDAYNFGILTEAGSHNVQMSNSTLNGNWGVGTLESGGAIQFSSGTINGALDLQTTGGNSPQYNTITQGVHTNVATVGSALTTINNLASTLAAENGTSIAITGNGQTVNASAGNLVNGDDVFNVSGLNFSGGITVNGSANQYVVFDFNNGTSNVQLKGGVTLTGGISADHVLFNFTGTGGQLGGNTNGGKDGIINADFLFPSMKLNIDNTVINGRLLGGDTNNDFQFVSGMTLTAPPAPVPLPAAVWLLSSALGGLAAVRRKA